MPNGATGEVNCGKGTSAPVAPLRRKVETVFEPKFEVKTQKFPLVEPSERIVNATGFTPVYTVPPFATVIAVSAPVT